MTAIDETGLAASANGAVTLSAAPTSNENLAAAAKGTSTARVSAASGQLGAAQSPLTTPIDRQQNWQATSALQSVTHTDANKAKTLAGVR